MDDEFVPPTQSSGALVPPNKVPGTALAAETPPPPPNRHAGRTLRRAGFFRRLIGLTLDAVDDFADNVAAGLGLRQL